MTQRVERILVGRAHPQWEACRRLCSLARRLGNCAVYLLRHRIFSHEAPLTRKELDTALRTHYSTDYRAMPSAASAQRQGQIIAQQFKSYAAASKEYRQHPEKFLGKPKLPGYARKYRTFYVARNGYQIVNHRLTITGGGDVGFAPLTIGCCANQPFNAPAGAAKVGDLRIVPKGCSFVIEITYEKEKENLPIALDVNYACLVDLGLDNTAALCATRPGVRSVLVKGGSLKSLNHFYNKDMADLRSRGKKGHFSAKSFKRKRRIHDQLHKMSRFMVNYCLVNDLGKIIIGKNKGWKQSINLGRINNQKFVQIPLDRLIAMITYKAEDYGITVILREESYTSKASALDFDSIPDFGVQQDQTVNFSGKRIRRGLYRTKNGLLVNADIQGSANIGRKELGNDWLRNLLQVDEGALVDAPVVMRRVQVTSMHLALTTRKERYAAPEAPSGRTG